MLHFMDFSKTQVAAAILGVSIVPCGLIALAYRAVSGPDVTTECTYTATIEKPLPSPEIPNTLNEVSLQETLDQLGYTVNVPAEYGGHQLLRWNDYRRSTRDDSLSATSFHGTKMSHFTKVSEQAMLAGNLDFGMTDAQGQKRSLLKPDHNADASWISMQEGASCNAVIGNPACFYIKDTKNTFRTGPFSSIAQTNIDCAPHLLALPARKGGTWISEGDNTGHWEGGKETVATLLCWEDWQDFDYQDMVILAENVVPEKSPAKSDGKAKDNYALK